MRQRGKTQKDELKGQNEKIAFTIEKGSRGIPVGYHLHCPGTTLSVDHLGTNRLDIGGGTAK